MKSPKLLRFRMFAYFVIGTGEALNSVIYWISYRGRMYSSSSEWFRIGLGIAFPLVACLFLWLGTQSFARLKALNSN